MCTHCILNRDTDRTETETERCTYIDRETVRETVRQTKIERLRDRD